MGFEPTNGGSKIRCLTSWLLPEKKLKTGELGLKPKLSILEIEVFSFKLFSC